MVSELSTGDTHGQNKNRPTLERFFMIIRFYWVRVVNDFSIALVMLLDLSVEATI